MYKFKRDLARGQQRESYFREKLQARGGEAILNESNSYDLFWHRSDIVEEANFSFEIKTDFLAARTGNFAIEYMSRGKPSCLSVSQADYWVFYNGEQELTVDADSLKLLIQQNKFKQVKGGDNNTSELFLIPISMIEKIALPEGWLEWR